MKPAEPPRGRLSPRPPSPGDVLCAGRAYDFPALEGEGVSILAGEEAWRQAVTADSAERIWETLREADLEGDANDANDLGQDEDGDG